MKEFALLTRIKKKKKTNKKRKEKPRVCRSRGETLARLFHCNIHHIMRQRRFVLMLLSKNICNAPLKWQQFPRRLMSRHYKETRLPISAPLHVLSRAHFLINIGFLGWFLQCAETDVCRCAVWLWLRRVPFEGAPSYFADLAALFHQPDLNDALWVAKELNTSARKILNKQNQPKKEKKPLHNIYCWLNKRVLSLGS